MSEAAVVSKEKDVGRPIVYVDPTGQKRPALITAVWGPQCVNLVYVNPEEGQDDTYGQKIARATSCIHRSIQQAPGNYWLLPQEA